jgi:hypothetical protein
MMEVVLVWSFDGQGEYIWSLAFNPYAHECYKIVGWLVSATAIDGMLAILTKVQC